MNFTTFKGGNREQCVTSIKKADMSTAKTFIQTWVPAHITYTLQYHQKYNYALFHWDKIINLSFVVGQKSRCYTAITDTRLDGLISLNTNNDYLKIDYIATAPWNYYTIAQIHGVGSGMIYHSIMESNYLGFSGIFRLTALPDAEPFYQNIGMEYTGNRDANGLKEFHMPSKKAEAFLADFKHNLV